MPHTFLRRPSASLSVALFWSESSLAWRCVMRGRRLRVGDVRAKWERRRCVRQRRQTYLGEIEVGREALRRACRRVDFMVREVDGK